MSGFSDSSAMFDDAARLLEPGALSHDEIEHVRTTVASRLDEQGWTIRHAIQSPITGKGGNSEYLLHIIKGLQRLT